jgi:flavin reductase (DIM6/NTAB) family NADH-FMN oxidoreductase RutF
MTTDLTLERLDPATIDAVLGHVCTGNAVITGHDGVHPLGFACQSVTSVSLRPPYLSLCPDSTSSSWPLIRKVGSVAINVLAADERTNCLQFATTGRDKFVLWSYRDNYGEPA